MANHATYSFKTAINPNHAEEFVAWATLPTNRGRPVYIDLSECGYLDGASGYRIGNSLRLLAQDAEVHVSVPQLDPLQQLRFRRSGLGYALAFHCSSIRTQYEDCTATFKEEFKPGTIALTNHCLFHSLITDRAIEVDDYDRFLAHFRPRLSALNATCRDYVSTNVKDLATLVFESCQNIYDHASKPPLDNGTRILDYLSLNYYKSIHHPPVPGGHFDTYFSRLKDGLAKQDTIKGYLNVIVNDDGVGVAARHSQNLNIYDSVDRHVEAEILSQALNTTSSVKFHTSDAAIRHDPGYGTMKLIRSIKEAKSLATIRTGRLVVILDGTDIREDGFSITDTVVSYMPGTTLDIIVPLIHKESQLELEY